LQLIHEFIKLLEIGEKYIENEKIGKNLTNSRRI